MPFIKTFENFQHLKTSKLFIANIVAETLLKNTDLSLYESEGFYHGNLESIVDLLESKGFNSPTDFILVTNSLEEALEVKYEGHEPKGSGVEIKVSINGHKYGYTQKADDLDIADIARKFEKMLQFSAGKALSWLKKHTVLSSGGKNSEEADIKKIENE